MNKEREEYLKQNLIALIRDHKENCKGIDCSISFHAVYQVLVIADIKVTKDEFSKYFV